MEPEHLLRVLATDERAATVFADLAIEGERLARAASNRRVTMLRPVTIEQLALAEDSSHRAARAQS